MMATAEDMRAAAIARANAKIGTPFGQSGGNTGSPTSTPVPTSNFTYGSGNPLFNTGPTGPAKDTGPTGPTGGTGPTGPTGDKGKTILRQVTNADGSVTTYWSDGTITVSDPTGQLQSEQDAKLRAEELRRQGQSAYDILLSEFTRYGLQALVEPLKSLITSGASAAEFSLKLQQTDAYKKRFAANQERINKGLAALSPAEYIALEDQYQNVMRNYGLPATYYTKDAMGTQQGFEKFLAADVSATELEDRIMTAQNRVINANPEISRALKSFYPDITNGDILAYALNPQQGLSDIKRKVTAAEIGGAALAQGLQTGMTRAEELAGYGVTKDQAQQGFQTVAQIAPRGSQLASIYGQDPYTQATAEAEVFGTAGAAESAALRKKLTKLEQAQFAGSAGMSGGALSRDRAVAQGSYRSSGAGNF